MNNEFNIPKNHTICVQYIQNGKVSHIITLDNKEDIFHLYKVDGKKLIDTKHKSENPTELETWVWQKKI